MTEDETEDEKSLRLASRNDESAIRQQSATLSFESALVHLFANLLRVAGAGSR